MQNSISHYLPFILIPFLLILGSFKNNSTEEWKLILEKDGVSFYATNTESKISSTLNTLLKVKNSNEYQVFITFVPIISCNEGGEKMEKNSESTYIEPNDAHSLHTFKICEKGNTPVVSLKDIVIEKR